MRQEKILIVGQGIAGTVLSFKLSQYNISHIVRDNGHRHAATKAAAGIINPITGRNYVKSWMIDQLLPSAESTYKQLSDYLGKSYLQSKTIYRTLHNNLEYNNWMGSSSRPGYDQYVDIKNECPEYKNLTNQGQAYGIIRKAQQVNIAQLISDYQQRLTDESRIIIGELDYDEIELSNGQVYCRGEEFDMIIFCEGARCTSNPFFGYLPFQPVKGESFLVSTESKLPNNILRDRIFLAPTSDHEFWTGGSYQHQYDDDNPTEAFRQEWKSNLESLLKIPFKIKEHRAGIRPAVRGRKPLIGRHPFYKQLYLFNGMGTKATSLVPYWADHLVGHLVRGVKIDEAVDIKRFQNYYDGVMQ